MKFNVESFICEKLCQLRYLRAFDTGSIMLYSANREFINSLNSCLNSS